jgi:thiosulfate/3-mercaptopyruvate sulfurtransferase
MHLAARLSVALLALLAGVAEAGGWSSLVTAKELAAMPADENRVVVDARSPTAYEKGHLPGAINLHGAALRTPGGSEPGAADFFATRDGKPDIARYEKLLGDAGLKRENHVVVYGTRSGAPDGALTAMILQWLGQEKVQYLDGTGVQQWTAAGQTLSTEAAKREPQTYVAKPLENFVWRLPDVRANLEKPGVVFYDVRTPEEYTGEEAGRNVFGGHIPGAVNLDHQNFLRPDQTALPPEEVKAKLDAAGITPDKTVVLYCQTSTRVSLPYLMLRDLGYKNLCVYDGGWVEYGNTAGTKIEKGTK